MSYVWTPEQIQRYFGYYDGLATRNTYSYLTFSTTPEFAHAVLPPCLEPTNSPEITVSFMSFMEVADGRTNRTGRDRCAMIHINANFGEVEGIYYLTVLETEEVNLETGRELWGMPKKLGTIDSFDDGETLFAVVERKNHRIIEFEAEMGMEEGSQPFQEEFYFELRGHFGADGFNLQNRELVVFKLGSTVNRYRPLRNPHVVLQGSPWDPGVGTVPLGEFTTGGMTGGRMTWDIVDVINLNEDGNDYAPYILGRLYDDWPDLRSDDSRRPNIDASRDARSELASA
ncbi:acetoacetate decarboxylase family protein [Paenarthrobacter sp. 2TAF44]|uniref:acetoacetate decarboxylase family protein n=1 Tax=Paenarthrobacter sp. 2TAF44 TaxID=3233018 RepID=UPI003F9455BE